MTDALTQDQRGIPRKQPHLVWYLPNAREGNDGRHPQPAPHHPQICKRTLQDPTLSNVRKVLNVLDELRHTCSSLGNGWTAQLTHDADKLVDVKVYTSTHDQKGVGTGKSTSRHHGGGPIDQGLHPGQSCPLRMYGFKTW